MNSPIALFRKIRGSGLFSGCCPGVVCVLLLLAELLPLSATAFAAEGGNPVSITIAAAASLEQSLVRECIPLFRERHPWITVEGVYDSSGRLQTQIENGLDADVFFSAAAKQMNALVDKGFIEPGSVVELLENRIVLIRSAASAPPVNSFADAAKAGAIAVGDPDSVPAGQYAREAFTALGVWDEVAARASFGTSVTEVLNWVAEGSADVGVVYATDAALADRVAVVSEAPEGSFTTKVIYPAGMLKASRHPEEAGLFLDFLASEPAMAVFRKYGFSAK